MLRFLLRLSAFFLFSSVVYVVVLTFLPRPMPYRVLRNLNVPLGGNGHNYTRLQEADRPGDPEILILGSSSAYRGFDPRVFAARGYRSFNLGSSSQTPIQSEVLLHRYLKTHTPRTVLMEVAPLGLDLSILEGTLDLVTNAPVDVPTFELVVDAGNIRAWNAGIHALGKQLLWGPVRTTEMADNGLDRYIPGGYVERRMSHYSPVRGKDEPIDMAPEQLEALERIKATLDGRGIQLILVEAPVTKVHSSTYIGHDRYVACMRTIAPFINMNGVLPLDDSLHFYDPFHLNQTGVEMFDRALLDTLDRTGQLPPPSLRNEH
jgi:hypothetical protein